MQQIATRSRVFEAADAMRAAGQNPTRDAIRAQVGGSDTTISGHLRDWKEVRGKDGGPVSAQGEFDSLIARMIDEACRPLQAANGALVTQIGELAVELDDAHAWRHDALAEQARQHADVLALREAEIANLTERLALAGQQARHAEEHTLRSLGEVEELRRVTTMLNAQLADAHERILSLTRREAEARSDAAIWQERAGHHEACVKAAESARDEASALCEAMRGREDELYTHFHQRAREDARHVDFEKSADKLIAQITDLPLRVSEAMMQPIRQVRENASQQDDQGSGAYGESEDRSAPSNKSAASQAETMVSLGDGQPASVSRPRADSSDALSSAQSASLQNGLSDADGKLTQIFQSLTFIPTEAPG